MVIKKKLNLASSHSQKKLPQTNNLTKNKTKKPQKIHKEPTKQKPNKTKKQAPNKNNPTKCLETGRNFSFFHKPREENSPLKVLLVSFSWLPEILNHGLSYKHIYTILFIMSDSTLCHLENLPLTSMHFHLSKV